MRLGTVTEERHTAFRPLDVDQSDHDGNPVQAVPKDRTDGSVVVPTKDSVEDLPSTVGTDSTSFRVAVRKMPNIACNLVRSRAVAGFSNIATDCLCESLAESLRIG